VGGGRRAPPSAGSALTAGAGVHAAAHEGFAGDGRAAGGAGRRGFVFKKRIKTNRYSPGRAGEAKRRKADAE